MKKLLAEQLSVYRRTNVVKSEKFSEMMQMAINNDINGLITNADFGASSQNFEIRNFGNQALKVIFMYTKI